MCLSYYPITVKINHNQGNSYKGKYLIKDLLIVSEA